MRKLFIMAAALLAVMSAVAQTPDYSAIENAPRPRLFASAQDFEEMKSNQQGETVFAFYNVALLKIIRSKAAPKIVYSKDESGRRILAVSRAALDEIFCCSWAYKMAGENTFLQRVETAINSACNFPDWNSSHYLDVGEMALAISIDYDWLYDVLKPETSKLLPQKAREISANTASSATPWPFLPDRLSRLSQR